MNASSDVALRQGALVVQRSDLGTLAVRGSERLEWLQGVLTCDVASLRAGEARWGLSLTKQGKILSDVIVLAEAERVALGVPRVSLARLHEWLAGFLVMEDADIEIVDDGPAWLTLHGPLATEAALAAASATGGTAATLELTSARDAVILLPGGTESTAVDAIVRAGGTVATREDWLRLRVERVVPLYGVDMDETRSPHEASLDRRCVSWTKGCYLGQEAVCMQDMRGKVKRRLVVLQLDGEEVPSPGSAVQDASGAVVGEARSAAAGVAGTGVATLAFLSTRAIEAQSELSIGGRRASLVWSRGA